MHLFLLYINEIYHGGVFFLVEKYEHLLLMAQKSFKENQLHDALYNYNKVLEIKDDDPLIWNQQGLVLANLGLHEDAIISFDVAIKLDSENAKSYSNKGVSLAALSRLVDAADSFRMALNFDFDDADIWSNLATCHFGLEEYEEALNCYNQALSIDSNNPAALIGKGSTLRFLGEYEEALKFLEDFMNSLPPELEYMREEAWAMMLSIKLFLGYND